jgi:hypothetical protein
VTDLGDAPFDEPWQARLLGTAVATVEALGLPWDSMRDRLKAAVAEAPDRPYYESLLVAFERLLEEEARVALASPAAG